MPGTPNKSERLNILATTNALDLAGALYSGGYTEDDFKKATDPCTIVHQNWGLFTRAVDGDEKAVEQIASILEVPSFVISMGLMEAQAAREAAKSEV